MINQAEIYLDLAATAPLHPAAASAVTRKRLRVASNLGTRCLPTTPPVLVTSTRFAAT